MTSFTCKRSLLAATVLAFTGLALSGKELRPGSCARAPLPRRLRLVRRFGSAPTPKIEERVAALFEAYIGNSDPSAAFNAYKTQGRQGLIPAR